MDFKELFTIEEIDELATWFNTHKYEQTVDLGNGISTTELDKILVPMLRVAQTRYRIRAFSGQIYILFRIREILIKEGKVLGEK